jgi:hypothetical protein
MKNDEALQRNSERLVKLRPYTLKPANADRSCSRVNMVLQIVYVIHKILVHTYPHRKKSQGMTSGDWAGQEVGPVRPEHFAHIGYLCALRKVIPANSDCLLKH